MFPIRFSTREVLPDILSKFGERLVIIFNTKFYISLNKNQDLYQHFSTRLAPPRFQEYSHNCIPEIWVELGVSKNVDIGLGLGILFKI